MHKDLKIALQAARKGVETIKKFQATSFEVRGKGYHDLVTDADFATEKVILDIISGEFPDDEILAEETENEEILSNSRTWIVDPIDGTTNFAHGFPIFCVSIALWENKKPKIGVVIEVNRNEEFTAVAGEGAWLNGEKISVSSEKDAQKAFVATGFPYNDLSLIDPYLKLFKKLMEELQGIRRPGAATYDLCCVACGRFDAFYEYSLHAWDVAAASLIIQEAGGVVSDWKGEQKWLFGQRMIAGNQNIHSHLLKRINEYIPQELRKSVVS